VIVFGPQKDGLASLAPNSLVHPIAKEVSVSFENQETW
jgi:hypothetical protein